MPLTIQRAFDELHFSDAHVLGVERDASGLTLEFRDVGVMPEHPDATSQQLAWMDRARLTFTGITQEAIRAYDSADESWADLAVADAVLGGIAEVVVDGPAWKLTGFGGDGRWLEWTLTAADAVLTALKPAE